MRSRIVAILSLVVASAALPLFAQTINGCVDTKQGTLRIVKPGEPCDAKEYAVSWNQQGVAGKDGKDGTNGVNGLNGINGVDGKDGKDGANCEPAAPQPPAQIGTIAINGISGGPYGVYQFSGGVTMPATSRLPGGGTGRPDFQDVAIVRKVDAASPTLMERLASGDPVQDVTITFTPGSAGPRFVRLFDVVVTTLEFTRLTGSNDLFETISFSYSKIEFKFDNVTGCWDIARGQRC